jgi:hypothetical protein
VKRFILHRPGAIFLDQQTVPQQFPDCTKNGLWLELR